MDYGGDWSSNRLIPDCIRSLLKKKIIHIRNPNFNRPWQHVLEPLKGYLFLAKNNTRIQKNTLVRGTLEQRQIL